MRSEARIFNFVAIFLVLMAVVYGTLTFFIGGESLDWVGSTALVLSGGLCFLCGSYFSFVARRIAPRPEDRVDGEISDGAGDLGFFSPGSYWPLGIALATGFLGLGLVYSQPWMLLFGGLAVVVATGGLLFEYYTGSRSEADKL